MISLTTHRIGKSFTQCLPYDLSLKPRWFQFLSHRHLNLTDSLSIVLTIVTSLSSKLPSYFEWIWYEKIGKSTSAKCLVKKMKKILNTIQHFTNPYTFNPNPNPK